LEKNRAARIGWGVRANPHTKKKRSSQNVGVRKLTPTYAGCNMRDKVKKMLIFLPLGMNQDEINELAKRGITYDKSTKKQLLRAYV
jgi:hypothetical protein